MDPRIHLAIDTCFAIKRWTTPKEWLRVIRDMGLRYVEVVTDVEIEPLLMDADYRREWADEVLNEQEKTGIKVICLYSGNSTYDTTGLAHSDKRVRDRIINVWFNEFMNTAARLDAGIGYFIHAFPEYILLDKTAFDRSYATMTESLVRVNRMAAEKNIRFAALENMYTPHQSPFTITGTISLMQTVTRQSGYPLHFTEDVAHHSKLYLPPGADDIRSAHKKFLKDGSIGIWLGSRQAVDLFKNAGGKNRTITDDDIHSILGEIKNNRHLFAEPCDTDCYEWLRRIGCYSPVIHLQQTDGSFSSHKPFVLEANKTGIIEPLKILKALRESYEKPQPADFPQKCEDIYLSFVIYSATMDMHHNILYKLRKTVEYWRNFIPSDGLRLSKLLG
jgi:sugar phosphate isomerase/epimerase